MIYLQSTHGIDIRKGSLCHWQDFIEVSDEGSIVAIKAENGAIFGNLYKTLKNLPHHTKLLLTQRKLAVLYEWCEEAEPFHNVIAQIESFCKEESVDPSLFWYLTGNYTSVQENLRHGSPIQVRGIPLFIAVASWAIPQHITRYSKHREHTYLCLMRNPHTHRWITLRELDEAGLIHHGLVSFSGTQEDYLEYRGGYPVSSSILSKLPLIVDIPTKVYDHRTMWHNDLDTSLYSKTHLSLVVESFSDRVFFTEKICKPIAFGHAFLVVGGQHYLKILRSFGFKTFSDWWDESYDEATNDYERIRAVVNVLKMVSSWSSEEWSLVHEEMADTLRHNQNLIRSPKFMALIPEILSEINSFSQKFRTPEPETVF